MIDKRKAVYERFPFIMYCQQEIDKRSTEDEIEMREKLFNCDFTFWNIEDYDATAEVTMRNLLIHYEDGTATDEEISLIFRFIIDTLGGFYGEYAKEEFGVEIGLTLKYQCAMKLIIDTVYDIITDDD